LARRIGPVKANTFQQSSRIANALREGAPARSLEALAEARVIVCAGGPAQEMESLLLSVERRWDGALVIFAGSPESDPAPELERLGAQVATATILPGAAHRPLCLVSGSPEAGKLLRSCGARVVRARRDTARSYRVASEMIETAVPQLLEAAAVRLKHAGLSTSDLRSVVREQTASAVKSYLRTRRRPIVSEEIERLVSRIVSGDAVP
jgi:hypothetical protein